MVNFDLPEGIQPTPTFPPPTDEYYEYISAQIIEQKLVWQKELGWDQGRQKTVDWLNRNLTDTPVTPEIDQAIKEAKIDEYDPYTIWFYFKNGLETTITDPYPPDTSSEDKELYSEFSTPIIASFDPPSIVKNGKILMLGSKVYEDRWHKNEMFGDSNSVKSHFVAAYGAENVKCLGLINYKLSDTFPRVAITPNQNNPDDAQVIFHNPALYLDFNEDPVVFRHTARCEVIEGKEDSLPRPKDFINMDSYGVVYIDTHGFENGLMACVDYEEDPELYAWLNNPNNKGKWHYGFQVLSILYEELGWELWLDPDSAIYFRGIVLEHSFFSTPDDAYGNDDFGGTFVYLNACFGKEFFNNINSEGNKPFPSAKVFISPFGKEKIKVHGTNAYAIFKYMLAIDTDEPPKSAGEAWKIRNSNIGSDKNKLYINNENDNTYLPGDAHIVLYKQ